MVPSSIGELVGLPGAVVGDGQRVGHRVATSLESTESIEPAPSGARRHPAPARFRLRGSTERGSEVRGRISSPAPYYTHEASDVRMSAMTYEQLCAGHRWEVPERFNIAADVCDQHPREKLAMIHEHFDGATREATGASCRTSRTRRRTPSPHGRRPRRPRRGRPAAHARDRGVFFGVWKLGALLLSMSVLYGDEGIRHRLATPKREYSSPTPPTRRASTGGAPDLLVLDEDTLERRPPEFDLRDTPRTTRPSSTTRRARRASRRGSCTPTATSSPTRSSATATRCRTGSASTGWASGRGRPASLRCSGRGASAPSNASTSVRADSTRTGSSTSSAASEVTNVFATPTAIRSMMAIEEARTRTRSASGASARPASR